MKINKIKTGIEFLILITLLSSFVSAFAVSYIWGTTLKMYPGESRDIYFTLQNKAGDLGDINARVELLQGQEIVTLTDGLEIYSIPQGEYTQVNFTIKIPENAKYEDFYKIEFSVTTIEDKESGGMGFAMGIGQKMEVIVIPRPGEEAEIAEESPQLWGVLVFVGLAIIIIVVVLITLVKKRLRK